MQRHVPFPPRRDVFGQNGETIYALRKSNAVRNISDSQIRSEKVDIQLQPAKRGLNQKVKVTVQPAKIR